MIRVIGFVLATTVLAGCATQPTAPAVMTSPPPATAPAVAEAPPAPKPQYGTFGLDTAGMDTSVSAGNDFFGYANGSWAKNTTIPERTITKPFLWFRIAPVAGFLHCPIASYP